MPVQCNQGWLDDLRLCGPFSWRWRSFFIDTGTGGIAFPLQQLSFMPDTMRYYWFWIEMLILGTGQLGLSPAHFSFFTWLRWSFSMGRLNPQLPLCYDTLDPIGKDWGLTDQVSMPEWCSIIQELKGWWERAKPWETQVHTQGAVAIDPEDMEENPTFSGPVMRARQVSALLYSLAETNASAGLADLYMTGIKQHNQIACATI